MSYHSLCFLNGTFRQFPIYQSKTEILNFKFDENGRKFFKKGRKHCGKRRNCSLRAISPFPTGFSKDLYCRHVKTRACLGKG